MRSPAARSSASIGLALGALLLGGLTPVADAQLPWPQLFTVFPAGARAGSTVEVEIGGGSLDDVKALQFDHPGIQAAFVKANTFKVTVAAGVPLGNHDVRAVGKYGISNPRTFTIGDRPEINETEPNNDRAKANRVALDSTVNGRINGGTDIDWFVFHATKGQRVIIDCNAQRIDSRLDGTLLVTAADGKELASNRDFNIRDPLVDLEVPANGDYFVKLYDFVYGGSPEYFYRLTISTGPYLDYIFPPAAPAGSRAELTLYGRNLPGGRPAGQALDGRPLEKLAVTVPMPADPAALHALRVSTLVQPNEAGLDGFEYRLKTPQGSSNPVRISFTTAPPVLEKEPNDTPETAQKLTLPCEVQGRFSPSDNDWYTFEAKKGAVYVIEAYAQRIGSPADVDLVLRKVNKTGPPQDLGEFDDNGANIGQIRFTTNTDDPMTRWQAPEDGVYQLLVAERFNHGDPRYTYRLSIRPPAADFQVVIVPNHDTMPDSLTVRQGGRQYFDALAFRQDDFQGDVHVEVSGLPRGVQCTGAVLGPNVTQAPLVFSADAGAPAWAGPIQVRTWAMIGGKRVERDARGGVIIWPTVNTPAFARMTRTICLAVRPGAPYRLDAAPAEATVGQGHLLPIHVQVTRKGGFADQVQLTGLSLPNGFPAETVNVVKGRNEGTLDLVVPKNLQPGTYTFAIRGDAQVPFSPDGGKTKQTLRVTDPSNPITVTVLPGPVELSLNPAAGTVKAGGTLAVAVTVNRKNGYTGPVTLRLAAPAAVTGVTAAEATVPAGMNQGKLTIAATPKAGPAGPLKGVAVRSIAIVNGKPVEVDEPLNLTVAK